MNRCVALGLIVFAAVHAAADLPRFAVSVTSLGVAGGRMEPAEFVKTLNAAGWCRASEAPPARRWDERPAAAPAGEWISVVLAGFGEQAEAFAFMADRPNGALRLVGHVSYRKTPMPSGSFEWIPPAGRLVAAMRAEYDRPAGDGGEGEPVGYRVSEWKRPAAAGGLTMAGGLAGLGDSATEEAAAPTVSFGEGTPAIEALFCGALCRNGWAPVRAGADSGVALEVRFGYRSAAVRIARTGGGASAARQKLDIQEDFYYGFLRRMLRQFRDERIADFVRLGSAPVAILAATSNRLCVAADGEMRAYDPRSGRLIWPEKLADPSARRSSPPPHAVRVSETGVATVYLTAKGVAVLDLDTGRTRSLAAETPAAPDAFAVREDGLVVVAVAAGLAAFRDGALVWRRNDLGGITDAPIFLADRICVSRGDGLVACLAAGDGKDIWRSPAGKAWLGGLVRVGDRLIGFSRADEALVGLSASDGAPVWRLPVGDALLKAPVAVAGRVLAVGKNNRLLVLDPANGKPAAETVWPTWIVDVRVVPGAAPRLACTDIEGCYTELDAATLKPVRAFSLPARPAGQMVFAPRFPLAWGSAQTSGEGLEDLFGGETGPAVLATDEEGYCTIIGESR
jgi:hypothetical protein